MSRPRHLRPALCAGLILAVAGAVPGTAGAEIVDVELVLAVDVSLSMSPDELAIQRDGYAAALTHEQVIRAIRDGVHGKIALAYVEWAGAYMQNVVVPWTIISGAEEAAAFAERLTRHPPSSARRTSISGALHFAADLFAESEHRGMKRVVDISGDGPNNQGPPVTQARDALVAQGITINGLPLMTSGGFSSVYDLAHLDRYYEHCVIGGPGAFMIPVNDWSQFPEAVRRKLVLELAGTPQDAASPDRVHEFRSNRPEFMNAIGSKEIERDAGGKPLHTFPHPALVVPASAGGEAVDCEIGEKMWLNRSWMWDAR